MTDDPAFDIGDNAHGMQRGTCFSCRLIAARSLRADQSYWCVQCLLKEFDTQENVSRAMMIESDLAEKRRCRGVT